MHEKYTRHFLKDKDAKTLMAEASKNLNVNIDKLLASQKAEIVSTEGKEFYLFSARPLLFKHEKKIYPTLVFEEYIKLMPKVVVDMGAVPHVCKGADIMAPGVRTYEGEFNRGDLVAVVDETHRKPIALGEALYDSHNAESVKQGAIVKNIHYVGDKAWELLKKVRAREI
jgi:PUA domain protein